MEAKAEKIKIEEPALELIAAAAEGSMRDAESLLDQIASLAGKENITLASAEHITGRTGLKKIHALAALIVKKDLAGATSYLETLNEDGHNLVQCAKDLIHYLRKVLSLKLNPTLGDMFGKELTTDELAQVKALGAAAKSIANVVEKILVPFMTSSFLMLYL